MVATLTDADMEKVIGACRDRPGTFLTEVLDVRPEHYWSKMEEMERAMDEHERVSVRAGHGVSKTYTMARLALKFLYTRAPSTVVTTAPTGQQIKEVLWRSIRRAHANAKMPLTGKLTSLGLDLQEETDEEWYATGFATKPDTVTREATAFQGYHNRHLLVIFDEAAGILPEIWRAAQYVGGDYKRWVVIGNPTSPAGEFPATFRDPNWHNIAISVKDTPNFKAGKLLIPGVHGRREEKEVRDKYGVDSDEYRVRILGEISNKAALGSYYGAVIAELRAKGMVCHPEIRHDPCQSVYTVGDYGYTTGIWWFQAGPMGPRCLDYYEDSGRGVEDFARVIYEKGRERNYHYGAHFAPADIDNNAQRATVGKTMLEIGREIGLNFTPLQVEKSKVEGIERSRRLMKTASFAPECAYGVGLLEAYHERINKRMSTEDKPVFTGSPEKDGTDHCADGWRYLSMAWPRLPSASVGNSRQIGEYAAMYRGAYA